MKICSCVTKGCSSQKRVNKFGPKTFLCDNCKNTIKNNINEPILDDTPDTKIKYVKCFVCGDKIPTGLFSSNEQICNNNECIKKSYIIYKENIYRDLQNIVSDRDKLTSTMSMKEFIYIMSLNLGYMLSTRNSLYKLINNWIITPSFVGAAMVGVVATNQTTNESTYVTVTSSNLKIPKNIITECKQILQLRDQWLKSQKQN